MPNAAPITGTFLAPGVSKNGRLYDKAAIGKAVTRMQERIADPTALPIIMRTHHAASDDSTKIAAVVTAVQQLPNGSATWEAAPVGTQAGKDIAAAARPGPGGKRALAAVSIRGWWLGPVSNVEHAGQSVETADDLEIDGIDFTASPGVDAARIATFETQLAAEAAPAGRTPITESVEALVADEITDQATTTETTVTYADPGYQADKKNRYPIDTKAHVQAAWAYINQTANQKPYTAPQVTKIKAAIKAAAKRVGVTITSESAGALTDLAEAYLSISASNGPADVNISAYGVDNADLDAAGAKLGQAAQAAVNVLDPDQDNDLDLDNGEDVQCPNCAAVLPGDANYCPNCGTSAPTTTGSIESTDAQRRPAVAESKSTAPKADAKATESTDGKPAGDVTETAKPDEKVTETAPVTETKPVTEAADVTETVRNAVTEAVKAERQAIVGELGETMATKVTEAVDALRSEIVTKYGPPRRAGLVADEGAPEKPVDKMTTEEFNAYATATWDRVLPQAR